MYDCLIIGAGPAGISAAIYIHRFGYKPIIIGAEYGGACVRTHLIENYPGYPSISGWDLMQKFEEHYQSFGIELKMENIVKIEKKEENGHLSFIAITDMGEKFEGKTVLITTGTKYRKLNIPGEAEFHGRGLSYCATCDGAFYRDKKVIVVGGSDSAAKEALFLTKFAAKVFIVYRKEKLRCEHINRKRIEKEPKIQIIPNTVITELIGDDNGIKKVRFNTGELFDIDGVFVEIGADPNSELVVPLGVSLNDKKEIIVDEGARTNVKGIYAAGDVTQIREKQVISAAAHGVCASFSIREYLDEFVDSCTLE
jgi:thioredoxin reductase (NADPH)